MTARLCLLVAVAAASIVGCASNARKYDWGSYDPSLYAYYRDPTKVTALSTNLQAIITNADAKHARVPPGIYAEYGYLQLQQGKDQEAITLFRQEETHWPESKVFMDHMIEVASKLPASPNGESGPK